MNISELKVGMATEGITVLAAAAAEAVTKGGKPYYKMTIRDKSGSIEARIWDFNPTKHPTPKEGNVYTVWGQIEEFAGTLQMHIRDLSDSPEPADKFAKWTEFDIGQMWTGVVDVIGGMREPLAKFVSEELLLKHTAIAEAFKKAPAARGIHNAWYGGLLEHTHNMLKMASGIIKNYWAYCPQLSADKVNFGVLVHDLGKILEYDFTNPSFKHTAIGNLTNHLVTGPAWVYEAANRWSGSKQDDGSLPTDKFRFERAHLMHIVAAHHGKLEWGSPVAPASLEAVIVHHLDNLDSKMMHAIELVRGKPGQVAGFSEPSHIEKVAFVQYPAV
jgi:3'-5' exoribonuclease